MRKLYISLLFLQINVYICCTINHYNVKAVLIVIIAAMRVHTVRVRLSRGHVVSSTLEEQKLVDSDDICTDPGNGDARCVFEV